VTGTAWIGLEQNFIDTAVNEWRNRLLACVCIVGQHFKQFYCRQLKNGQLNEMSASVRNVNIMCIYVGKVFYGGSTALRLMLLQGHV